MIRLKVYLINILLPVVFLGFAALEGHAQSRNSGKKSSEFWRDKVWFGGGFNLGFGSNFYNNLNSNIFGIGVSPMAGYKFSSWLSAGPRFSIDFTTAKFSDAQNVYRYTSVDYALGAFARAKFFQNFFVHTEYSQLNETYTTGLVINNELEKYREWRDILLLGLGYSSGGELSYEVYICYDFLEDPNSFNVPVVYRFGITYRF
ncbi:MAG: hypothetical protein IT266_07660 [Saprospiraceae bacterium]|nr:hypothetical protein [Saprospiraceae bacterium]